MITTDAWCDIFEILFFSTLFYHLALWLRKDRDQNLLWYFYGYCCLTFVMYSANLSTVSSFLFLFSPAIIMLFVIVHQETLQRNFVALKQTTPEQIIPNDWLETLLQSCLVAINNNKEVTCIIECTDNLRNFLETPLTIHANLNKELLTALLNSQSYNKHKMVWLNSVGKLLGINASWRRQTPQQSLSSWQEDAYIHTTKTDAVILKASSISGTFSIMRQGKLIQNITAQHAHTIVQKHIQSYEPYLKKGSSHEKLVKKYTDQKHTS